MTNFSESGVHAVDREVEVAVLGIAVERVEDLMLGQAHLVEERGHRRIDLGGRGLHTAAI